YYGAAFARDPMQVMIRNMAQLVRIAGDINCNDLVVFDLQRGGLQRIVLLDGHETWRSQPRRCCGLLAFARVTLSRFPSSSSLMKNLKSSAFVLRFSSSYKRSVRFGSEWSGLVATLPYSEPTRS